MKPSIIACTLMATAVPLFGSTTAMSTNDSSPLTTSNDSQWHLRTAAYGWFTSLNGDIGIQGHVAPVDVKFADIVDKIDASFMGIVEFGRGPWSIATDLFYAKLGADNTRDSTIYSMEAEQFIGNCVVAYRILNHDHGFLDAYAGARANYLSSDLYIDRPILADTNASGSKTWVDPIIGVRTQYALSDTLFIRAVADIGGFDVKSDLTWQALTMLGYQINENSAVGVGYRALGTDYTDGGFKYDVISHGLLIGFEHKF